MTNVPELANVPEPVGAELQSTVSASIPDSASHAAAAGSHRAAQSDGARLEQRLDRMADALDQCVAQVPAGLAIPARERLDTVAERLALGVDHTVVAFFGGTGSGKSSLFNALTGLDFADVGARRPTTSRAAACSWGDDAGALLTFLGVDADRRIRRESVLDAGSQDDLAGLVLLDVPDYDSVTREHALQVDRLVPLADILIWVLDPQKYADSALHDGYLRSLGARSRDMLIVVNQIDTLPEGSRDHLLDDVRQLLVADGLEDVTLLPVSARTGENLERVRAMLAQRVAGQSTAARTASNELDQVARRLAPAAASRQVAIDPADRDDLVDALVSAGGAQAVADSVATNLARVVPGALARPQPPAVDVVASALSRLMAATTAPLPSVWRRALEAVVADADTLATLTAEAVASVRLPAPRRTSHLVAWCLGVALVVAGLVGDLVLGARSGLAHGGWAGPVLCLAALLAGVCALLGARGARRRRAVSEAARYREAACERVGAVVERAVTGPAQEVLDRHEALRQALAV